MSPEELDFGESNYVDDSIQTISKLKEQIETLKAALRQDRIERLLSDVLQDAEAIQQRAADFRNEGQTVVTIPQDAYDQLAPRLLLIGEYEKILSELIKEIKRLLFDVDLKTRQHANQSLYIGSLQGMLTDFNEIMEWQEEQLATKDEEIKRLQELGLQIEQEASYVKRLEEKISDFYECDATRRGCCRQVAQDQARAALAKIREGKE